MVWMMSDDTLPAMMAHDLNEVVSMMSIVISISR